MGEPLQSTPPPSHVAVTSAARDFTSAAMASDLATGLEGLTLEPPAPDTRQAFLRFRLGDDWALLPLSQATEILQLPPVDILPVPAMPAWVLGVHNWRGEMLWLLDLDRLVGFPSICSGQHHLRSLRAIVVEIQGHPLAIAVEEVRDIELHDEDKLQPTATGLFSDGLLPWLGGYFVDGGPVLDARTLQSLPF